ncbi:MAG: YaiO family outer membrane beta-barrel protein [Bacteroidetes bacterium]|nr:MAG: YaiO family outer membrane beta-barrel protein [Bacteroidota bacterium]
MHGLLHRLARWLCLALVGVPAALAPPAASGQWSAGLFHVYDAVGEGRTDWQAWSAHVQRRFGRGALIAEVLQARRFGATDEALALDAWADLWHGAYANVRVQTALSTPRILPRRDVYAEVYQGLGPWEAAAHYRLRAYAGETIHAYGVGLGLYRGAYYLRARLTLTPRLGRTGWAQTLTVRRYWNAPLEFVEVLAGRGRAIEIVDVGPVIRLTRTAVVALRVQRFVTPRLGLTAGLAYSDDDFFTRQSLTLGLLARW